MYMKVQLDRISTAGVFITALASPCCFPLFGVVLTFLGFGSFELFGGWTMWVFQAFVLLSIVGTYLSYRKHRSVYPLLIAVASAGVIFYSYHYIDEEYWTVVMYSGMFGLMISSVYNYIMMKKSNKVILQSVITCPSCGHVKEETMPTNACQFFYECEQCKTRLKPLSGDCCVFCSYGTVKCPPIQKGENCC